MRNEMEHQGNPRKRWKPDGRRAAGARPGRAATLAVTALVASTFTGLLSLAGAPVASANPAALTTGDITTFAGSAGAGTPTQFSTYAGPIAVTPNYIYLGDYSSMVLRRYNRANGTYDIIAGHGSTGYGGDNGPALQAEFKAFWAIAADGAGNVYVGDQHRIRRIDGAGTITTFAGTAAPGNSGDGGPATSAQFNSIGGLAFGPDGTLYVSDGGNNTVRQISPAHIVTRVAGDGTAGYGGDSGNPLLAQFNGPRGLAVSGGNLFVADQYNHRVREITGGIIFTVAGTGTSAYNGDNKPATTANIGMPNSIAFGGSGAMYVTDYLNNRIRKITGGGTITTVAGDGVKGFGGDGGPATAAHLQMPSGLFAAADDSLIISDTFNARVRAVSTGGTISTLIGNGSPCFSGDNGPASAAQLCHPQNVAVDRDGSVLIADSQNNRVRRVDTDGTIHTIAGTGANGSTGDGGNPLQATFQSPESIAIDSNGAIYVGDGYGYRIRRIFNNVITTYVGTGTYGSGGDGGSPTAAQIGHVRGMAFSQDDTLYFTDTQNNKVRRVSPGGVVISTVAGTGVAGYGGDGGAATAAKFDYPSGLALGPDGSVYVADTHNHRVRKFAVGGSIQTVAGTGVAGSTGDNGPAFGATVDNPWGIAVDGTGTLFISEGTSVIRAVGTDGMIRRVAGTTSGFSGDGGAATNAQLALPNGVAVDLSGNLFVADNTNNRVRRIVGVADASTHFNGLPPTRVLDSRLGVGFTGPLQSGAGQVKSLAVRGVAGVPVTATAVVMNVTATESTAGSFLTVYPAGAAVPNASNLNFAAGQTIPNLVTVRIGDNGKVNFYNAVGATQVVADVVGYYDNGTVLSATAERFVGYGPTRLLDTRSPGNAFGGPLGPNADKQLTIVGLAGVPADVRSVALNVTVTGATKGSFLTVHPGASPVPTASNLNFGPNQTISNMVVVKVGANGTVAFHNELGSTHVIVDIVGLYRPALAGSMNTGRFHPMAPTRILDDRVGTGGYNTKWGPKQSRVVTAAGANGIPAGATAVVVNVTATNGTAGSFLTVYPDQPSVPVTSSLNFAPNETIPNLAIAQLVNGKFRIYNEAGSVDVVGDVVGFFADF